MTKVYAQRDGNRYMISAQGHATGSVEACAAVSGLLYALGGWLFNHPDVVEVTERRTESGDALMKWSGGDMADAVFTMTVTGLLQIEKQYWQYLSVKCREI